MNKKIIALGTVIVICLILVGIIISFGNYSDKSENREEGTSEAVSARIVLYQQGKNTKLDSTDIYFEELQEKSENLFVDANDALDLVVTEQIINRVKKGPAVEILYSKPKKLGKKPWKIDALLVSFEDKGATIYYSVKGKYSSGPRINTKKEEVEKVRSLFYRALGSVEAY